MSYQDNHGITEIKAEDINNLRISWDFENDPNDLKQRIAVLLFTPSMKNTGDHYHIELDRKEARDLRDWLSEFIDEI